MVIICCLGLIIAMWGWVEGTRQALRHALSFLLSPSDRYFQTVFSTGFHVIPLWTAKLTSLCIIENYRTKKTMKGVSFYWLWVGDEGNCKWRGGGGISFSPNHTEDSWEETAKTKSEHADCGESKSSWRMKRASLQHCAATPCFCWRVRETTRNLESCNEWFNEQICPFYKRESHLSSKCQILLSLYFAIVSLMHRAGLKTFTATMETIFQNLNIKCIK